MNIFKIKELIEEIKDGIEIGFEVEPNAVDKIAAIVKGQGGELPIKIKVKIDENEVDK